MSLLSQLRSKSGPPSPDPVAALRKAAEPLPDIDDPAFGALFDRYADARMVLIGEASHGTSEFYRARAAITRRLIERHGFSIVAVEADWPDANTVDRHVRRRAGVAVPEGGAFARFPAWMWRNREVQEFVAWLRHHNDKLPADRRVEFRGLDVYSLRASIGAVLEYLERADPRAAQAARTRYACLEPWQSEPAEYGLEVMRGLATCEGAVLEQLKLLIGRRLVAIDGDGEALFDAEQNARVVLGAERYYRAMYQGSRESWNLRDRHMFETLSRLMERRGREARAVVWAHNSHLGDARATRMGWSGELNLGELCRKCWRDEAVLIGQGTDRGTVAAADDWDGSMKIKAVRPSLPHSWERAFLDAGVPRSLTDWRAPQAEALRDALSAVRLQRAIGVIYRPQTERLSHYFEAVLAEQFDAFLWFEQTGAVEALGDEGLHEDAETYPFGL